MAQAESEPRIRVKFLTPGSDALFWLHQFPHGEPRWGRCDFLFDRGADDYDWLVVYDDIPPRATEPRNRRCEVHPGLPSNSLLVTTEPSSIKAYGRAFTRQFGVILTSQEPWALPHPQRIYRQPALHWFYGRGENDSIPFDRMLSDPPASKSADLSMVFSPKAMRHTQHWQRHQFMRAVMDALPQTAVFGRGARPLDDKAEALDPFRYHVAVENHVGIHHWTEKLADAYLGLTLPFYAGCPNAKDYFPADSFIAVDMADPAGAIEIIRRAIANNEYEKRLPAIREARRRVMFEYNLFAVLAREIADRHQVGAPSADGSVFYSRHALRRRSMLVRVGDAYDKVRLRLRYRFRRD